MSNRYGPRIVTDGLVLCLDAADKNSYPGSAGNWYDLSGNGYNHTLANGAVLATVDGVTCFNTTGTKWILDSGTTFTYPSSHTLIAWARAISDAEAGNWRTLWRTQPNDHPLLIQNNSNIIGYYDNNTGGAFQSYGLNLGTLGLENKWTMFTLVGTGGVTTCYINDNQANGSVNYTTSGNYQDAIGNTVGGSQPFGYVAVAQVYSIALTVDQIKQNYNATKGRFGL